MKALILASVMLLVEGCEEGGGVPEYGYVTSSYVPGYVPLPEYHAGMILPSVGSGGVGGYGYSGYGNNIMVTNPVGGPVGGTMISGY